MKRKRSGNSESPVRILLTFGLSILLTACQPSGPEPAAGAQERTVRVVTSGGFTAAYNDLAPRFEAETGITLVTEYGASSGGAADSIPERLARGEQFDVVILSRPSLDNLTERGFIDAESRTDLVRSMVGMAVRAGAPLPDISTPEKFTEVLLNASSIGYSASASGIYLSTELWPAMGIWEELQGKSRRIVSERVGAVVARGEAEIGFQQVSELLPIDGIEFVGPIPDALQQITVFSAAITDAAENPQDGRELIRFLASQAVAPLIESKGLQPVAGSR
jgi:molybdate transport system substrate-binding protein